MEIILRKKPKRPTVIEGFPGFGLVSTITTEFLLDHLKFESIGNIFFDELPAMAAVHKGKVVEPIGIYHNDKYNIVLIHGLNNLKGQEWKIAESIMQICKELNAKELISIEGVGNPATKKDPDAYAYANSEEGMKQLLNIGVKDLGEGIIMGVTGALMIKEKEIPLSCIFADTKTKLPDAKAAAKIIQVLDKHLELEVDYKPLLKQAQVFEKKLKDLIKKGMQAQDTSEKKRQTYFG